MSESTILDFSDPVTLAAALVDIPSPSHHETELADALEPALRAIPGVQVHRHGNTLLARTRRGLGERVILAGHIDTVPIVDNLPHRLVDGVLHGCGSVDMKSGLAVYLHTFWLLANDPGLNRDLTLIAYEGEEVSTEFNGLGHIEADLPEWLVGDIALLGEPSGAIIEAGCQGTLRLRITARGERAHSARAWLGENAAHKLAPVLTRIAAYQPRSVKIDECEYREGLNVVHLESGVTTNTIPDEAWLFLNFRFAPDRSVAGAEAHLREVLDFAGLEVEIDDAAPGALPGLGSPPAQELLSAVGGRFRAKYGWTDVARFAARGIPALNFGPGDPNFAHKKDEQCPVWMITGVVQTLRTWLT